MDQFQLKDVLRFVLMVFGVPLLPLISITMKLKLHVHSWDMITDVSAL